MADNPDVDTPGDLAHVVGTTLGGTGPGEP